MVNAEVVLNKERLTQVQRLKAEADADAENGRRFMAEAEKLTLLAAEVRAKAESEGDVVLTLDRATALTLYHVMGRIVGNGPRRVLTDPVYAALRGVFRQDPVPTDIGGAIRFITPMDGMRV